MEGGARSEQATQHLRTCGECSRVADAEQRLSTLIRSVPAVGVPQDFNKRLGEKIESRRKGGSLPAFGLRPGILVPVLAAVVVLFALFAIYLSTASVPTAEPVADKVEGSVPKTEEVPEPSQVQGAEDEMPDPSGEVAGTGEADSAGRKRLSEPPLKRDTVVPEPDRASEMRPGSSDLALRGADPITPPWASPGNLPNVQDSGPVESSFSPTEILAEFGIEAVYGTAGWKVVSVKPGSVGANAGVMEGDILKALDGQELSDRPLAGVTVGGSSLKIERNGAEMTLSIRPGN